MKKIFMLDDDVDMTEALKMALESNGYEVKAQHDEEKLIDNIREYNPDLIILDVMLPGDDSAGFRIARSVRHHDDIKNKPLIILSGVNEEGEFAGTFSNKDIDDVYLPITEFIDKPIDPADLIAKIEKLTA